MTLVLTDKEIAVRVLRKNFMVATIQQGRAALEHIQDTDPELAELITQTFPQQNGRAAFWLATEVDKTGLTPLQQLNREKRDDVKNRLINYIPLKHR